MRYTKIASDTFEKLQLNAGIVLKAFTPATGAVTESDILGATTGGCTFSAVNEYKDFGDGVDNCPKNMKELKRVTSTTATLSGTFIAVDATTVKTLCATADAASGKITPRKDLATSDFGDIWLVCDYSDHNGATKGGYIAIHLMNALSTGGFQLKTADEDKGQFAFVFTAHYSMSAQDTVPFEIYVKDGESE